MSTASFGGNYNGSNSQPAVTMAMTSPPPPPQPLPQQQQQQQQQQYRPAVTSQPKRKSTADTVKLLINEFNDYGHRTTVHGLGHMYQSTDIRRKFFWLFITIVGCIACGVHIYFIVSNYNEMPVNSVILNGGVHVSFPDVTLCNMYPISESVQYHGAKELQHHMSKYWQFFRGFINSSRILSENGALKRFNLARKFFQIFWASEDTRDLAHDDDLFIVDCRYKSRNCSQEQFKMVQNIDYWNCYTFTPNFDGKEDRRVYSSNEDEGLNLILYTNTHLRKLHPDNGLTTVSAVFSDVPDGHHQTASKSDHSNFLERYLVNYSLSLNQLLAGDRLEPDGIRVILHQAGTYPHLDMNSVIVGNGDYSNVVFDMQRKTSKNRPDQPCRETTDTDGADEIEYAAYYPGKDTRYPGPKPPPNFKKFKRDRLDYVAQRTQELFWSNCGCYTHTMPYQHYNSMLCYFCSNGTDPVQIERTQKRVACHDQVYEVQLKTNILDFFGDSQRFQPCTGDHYNVKMGSSAWPSQRDVEFLMNQYVIPAFLNEGVGNKTYNRILRNTRVFPIRDIIETVSERRDRVTGGLLLNWTVQEFLIRKSFLKIAIHADSPTGTLNEEIESYSFAEALSEIGGIFGLYAGVSLLTFFEFVELAYLMATKPKEVKQQEMDGKSKFAMLQQAMVEDGVSQGDMMMYKQLFDQRNCCARATHDSSHRCRSLIMEAEENDENHSVRRPVIVA